MNQEIDLADDFYYYLDENQVKFFSYATKRLGFSNEVLRDKLVVDTYKAVSANLSGKRKSNYNKRGFSGYSDYSKYDFSVETYRIFMRELEFKKFQVQDRVVSRSSEDVKLYKGIRETLLKTKAEDYVSATDISGFDFCPVSLCISKTFAVDEQTEETTIGVEMHKLHRLIYFTEDRKLHLGKGAINNNLRNESNQDFFDNIAKSKSVYVGHSGDSKKYLKSSKGVFIGQPDYIFTDDTGEKFVVEEKFVKFDKETYSFRDHHRSQLASYILGLVKGKITHGYLVYWVYKYVDEEIILKKCNVLKLVPNEAEKSHINSIYKSVLSLKRGNKISFSPQELDTRKCAKCVVRKYCGHKTGRFTDVSIPYKEDYYRLLS